MEQYNGVYFPKHFTNHLEKINVGEINFPPTLCNPMDCSTPGSSVHGILQAGIPEQVAIAFSSTVGRNVKWCSQLWKTVWRFLKS